ncbi:MAG: M6 family metalloprotease domain-containing protein [Chloroflexota bacterium]
MHLAPQSIHSISNPAPSLGDQKALILLADFPDLPGLFTGAAWYERFFGADGFADYYSQNSYGKLRFSGDVVGLDGDTPVINYPSVAYIQLPNSITYYADGRYGFKTGATQFPRNNVGVVHDALVALDQAGFDFSPYVNPATNRVETLIVVFGGSPHTYTQDADKNLEATGFSFTDSGVDAYMSTDGYLFDNFSFCPDQEGSAPGTIANIGICTHEHGHTIGMPDLYDFTFTTSGVGYFDIMGYGTYGITRGVRPFHFGAYSKAFFGWVEPTVVLSSTTVIALDAAEVKPEIIKLVPNGNVNSQEYFLLENRQPLGFDQDWLDAGLCGGLLIWHVDLSIIEAYSGHNLVNSPRQPNGPQHSGIRVVEADGQRNLINPPFTYGSCTDSWSVGQSWHAESVPSSNLWSGQESGISLTVQSAHSTQITLTIQLDNLPNPSPTPSVTLENSPTPTQTKPGVPTLTPIITSTTTPIVTSTTTPTVILTGTVTQTSMPTAQATKQLTLTVTATGLPTQTTPTPATPTSTPTSTPTVTLRLTIAGGQMVGGPGSHVHLFGSGFGANRQLAIRVNGLRLDESIETDAQGNFRAILKTHLASPSGRYTVTVSDQRAVGVVTYLLENGGEISIVEGANDPQLDVPIVYQQYLPMGKR